MRKGEFLILLLVIFPHVGLPLTVHASPPLRYSPGSIIRIRIPEGIVLMEMGMPNGTTIRVNLTDGLPGFLSQANGTLAINTTGLELGTYLLTWEGGKGRIEFTLDRVDISLIRRGDGGFVVITKSELTGEPLNATVTVMDGVRMNLTSSGGSTPEFRLPPGSHNVTITARSGNITGRASFPVKVTGGDGGNGGEEKRAKGKKDKGESEGNGTVSVRCLGVRTDRTLYFPGDVVRVEVTTDRLNTSPAVLLILPSNASLALRNLTMSGKSWTTQITLNSSVMLGRYVLRCGNITWTFYVDSYSISAEYENGTVRGRVTYHVVPPSSVVYSLDGINGTAEVVNGTFSIRVGKVQGGARIRLGCGNAQVVLKLIERNIYVPEIAFPGEVVVIRASFEPLNATLLDPLGRKTKLSFRASKGVWEAEVPLESSVPLGRYVVMVDGLNASFIVDSYEFNATYRPGTGLVVRVHYYVSPPSSVVYSLDGINGTAEVVNGTFLIQVLLTPGRHNLTIRVGDESFHVPVEVRGQELGTSPVLRKLVAYDPVSRSVVVRLLLRGEKGVDLGALGGLLISERGKGSGRGQGHGVKIPLKAARERIRRLGHLILQELEIPASPEVLSALGLPQEISKTKVSAQRVNATLIRVRVSNKLDTWYRFRVQLPSGYSVRSIVRADGKRIVNDLRVNRTTGEVSGSIRWYVEGGTLYFFDDPIYGYDVTLTPPQPNNSLAIEEVEAGQISAIVFPYSQGDDSNTVATHDHAGRTGDNFANDIDADAGSKVAIRYTTPAGTRQYGNDGDWYSTGDYYLTHISRENVTANTVPDGQLESVIVTEMQAQWSGYELNVTQKTIIRDNNRWFATVYYIRNPTSNTYTNLRFFQGMDWNFRGSYLGDDALYDPTSDVVYGNDTNAPAGDIQYGGFRGEAASTGHDVNAYYGMWNDVKNDNLNNRDYYQGDAGTALQWDRASLDPGEVWVVPVIWGLGYNVSDMLDQIQDGLAHLHDAGIKSIDAPPNGTRVNPNVNSTIWVNATAALYGVVDAEGVPVNLTIEKVGGGYSSSQLTHVDLYVPHNETAPADFLLDISSLSPGEYNITVRTQLPGDQNASNDARSIIIYITSFTVEPDQEKTVYPGSTAEYNVTAHNNDEEARFDFSIVQSTKGWPTELYDGTTLVAEDSDGDGSWDFVSSSYDSNGNGLPDMLLPIGDTNFTVRKPVPGTAPLGELDLTELNVSKVGDPSVYDTVSLYTRTVHPGSVGKQFYLHGDSGHTLNTTQPTVSSSETQIAANALDSWAQQPPFASEFVLSGDAVVTLYLRDDYSTTHDVTVTLIYTDGSSTTAIGYTSSSISLSTSLSPYTFTIPITSEVRIPRGSYLVLRIENGASYPLYVGHDSSHASKVEVTTYTYIRVVEATTDRTDYSPGETITVTANVTDPIGAYDISQVRIDVYGSDDTLYLSDTMTLSQEDSSSPPLWRVYTYSFSLSQYGIYTVEVTAVETNGVESEYNLSVYVSWPVMGRVYEDFGTLGTLDSSDVGLPNARVLLYNDTNSNGVLDAADVIIDSDSTDASGSYSLHSIVDGRVFVVVDSSTLISSKGLNSGHTWDEVWAEQTFQREWDGSSWVLSPRFGGRDPQVGDMEGGIREHYVTVERSNYGGESIDFGFSYEVVVNTLDRRASGIRPVGEVFRVPGVGSSWRVVFTHNYYENPVVVCTYNLPSSSDNEAVVRLKGVDHHSFKLRIQNPGGKAVTPGDVYCLVMEEGAWELDDGRRVEAHRVISDGTNANGNWGSSLMEHPPYSWTYTDPVVLGQVMTYNDSRWSVFWDSNGTRSYPPDPSNLYVGKHVGEDPITYRKDEVLGYVVVEAGNGTTGSLTYSAQRGPITIRGVGNSPPYSYSLGSSYSVGVATQSGMRGGNGGWAVLYGSDPISSSIDLAIDEDTLSDSERRHIGESVSYWVFSDQGLIFARVNDDRYAQGSFRQFLINANALQGNQRSYVVMMVGSNAGYASSWRITLNQSLGGFPALNDPAGTVLNGTVLNTDMSVRDDNSGKTGSTGAVGTGPDGVPGTGDECQLDGVDRPELEVYGGGYGDYGLLINASNTWVTNLSIFGFGTSTEGAIQVNGTHTVRNVTLSGLLIGLSSDGADPASHGLERNEGDGVRAISSGDLGMRVEQSLAGYNGLTGVHLMGGSMEAVLHRLESFSNGLSDGLEDGISVEQGASGITVKCSYLHDNAAYGFDSWMGVGNFLIDMVNVSGNGAMASQGEDGGIRIFGNDTVVNRSVIHDNAGPGVVVANWSDGGAISVNNSILVNSIFSNGEVGVDLDLTHVGTNPVGDNVTINDGQLVENQPNGGMDYPVILDFSYDPGTETLLVSGYINREDAYSGSPDFAGADVLIFLVNNTNGGDDLVGNDYSGDTQLTGYYGEGWIYLGRLVADSNGEFSGTLDLSSLPSWARPDTGSALTAMAHKDGVGSSEFGPVYKRKPVSVSVRKDLEPSGSDCSVSVTLTARNLNPWATVTRIYDSIPAGMVMSSPSIPPDGSSGNTRWWTVTLAPDGSPGSEKQITYTLTASSCGSSDYSLSDAFLVGVDPPSPPPDSLKLDVREYLDVRFRPDGTYTVLEHWGFLTLSNPTSDRAEDVRIYPGASGYVFYPDYPVPSTTPDSPPLTVDGLDPGSMVRWRFTAPLGSRPPIVLTEDLAPTRIGCDRTERVTLKIRVSALEDAGEVVLRKPLWWADRVAGIAVSAGSASISGGDLVWNLGIMRAGDVAELTLTAETMIPHGIRLPDAEVSFNRSSPPLLRHLRVMYAGSASISVEKKEESSGSYRVRAIFSNLAKDLSYNLTSICVYDGQPGSGRLVFCEEPNAVVGTGESWSSPVHVDTPPSPPEYYAVANFTGMVTSSGTYSSLRRAGDSYVPYALIEEPSLGCTLQGGRGGGIGTGGTNGSVTGTVAPPTRVAGRLPTGTRPGGAGKGNVTTGTTNISVGGWPNITLEKSCSPSEVEVGDLLVCRIVVTNEGNLSARELKIVDRMPNQLVIASNGRRIALWTVRDLKPGDSRVFKIILQAVSEGLAVNTAEAGERTASAAVRVKKAVGPVLRKYGFYMGEGVVRYLITVDAGHQVRMTDVLPEDVEVRNVESYGSPVDWAIRGNVLDLTVRGNGSARIYVDVYYFDWMTGGKMENRVFIPGGPEAKAYVRATGIGSHAYYGAFVVPLGVVTLTLLLLRRRKGILLDYWSTVEILASGMLPSNGMAITEAAYRRLMANPTISPILMDLISDGRLDVVEIDEGTAIRALILARKYGLDLSDATELVALSPGPER